MERRKLLPQTLDKLDESEQYMIDAKVFWNEFKQHQSEQLRIVIASKTKPRKVPKKGAKYCPISGCHGKAFNLKRHMAQCHIYLTKEKELVQ